MQAVELLAEPIRRWMFDQNWSHLREVQEKAIPKILAGGDVVISARTAAGKTEAAMLPLLTRLLARRAEAVDGFGVVYVSPLKALINDQYRRLESLCRTCEVAVHRWHGDVSAGDKKRARDRPSGILLITPESLEATLVRRGHEVVPLFGLVEAFIIDELHAFIGTERGIQLQSILSRLEIATGKQRIDRVGLSATLGDMRLAAAALRPGEASSVEIVEGRDAGSALKVQIRGYEIPQQEAQTALFVGSNAADDVEETPSLAPKPVVDDLLRLLRGRVNLLFAGSRANVEIYADALRAESERLGFPNEFFPHHGSLSKPEREAVETRLRDDPRPTTAVATTTLELGIDIGDVETVAQIGPGTSVASLRQRLGRSGRRPGKPAILRIFVLEDEAPRGGHPLDRLRLGLIQSIAMIEALRTGWCEPPAPQGLHLSTLIHQILALILQTGGISASATYRLLCERGAFRTVDKALFADLLRALAAPERRLIEQSPDKLLMIGAGGERLTESHEFYTVFVTEQDFRVVHDGRSLGVYPASSPLTPGQSLIFGGRRWRILEIDVPAKVILVKPNPSGRPPKFGSEWTGLHDHIVSLMYELLLSDKVPHYLDAEAKRLLSEARDAAREFSLDTRSIVQVGEGSLLLPWVGTKKLCSLALALNAREVDASTLGHAIELPKINVDAARVLLERAAQEDAPAARVLAARVAKPARAKFDAYLPPDLMQLVTVVERLDIPSIPITASALVSKRPSSRLIT
ncbi:DEAD/DEAH box helicase [Methylocystis heyeri]|uniref:DEAD/DEAH box helicase n=2 Tax=Methylocystis heyeri TaxID=391905 RepID=A0A6B8KK23_9HYPH|nr:DEAD/DEAH box helicase [Methylocystis heyeri]